jgi:hypothetical protein
MKTKITRLLCFSLIGWLLGSTQSVLGSHSIGSIGALFELLVNFAYLVAALSCLALMVAAFLKARKSEKYNRHSISMILIVVGYILIGPLIFADHIFVDAFNPWHDGEFFYVAGLSIFFTIVVINYFLPGLILKSCFTLFAVLAVIAEAMMTPGARIYYDNDPLSCEVILIKHYHHLIGGLPDGRLFFAKEGMPHDLSRKDLRGILTLVDNIDGEDVYSLAVSRKNQYYHTPHDKVINRYLNNPFLGVNYLRDDILGVILPANWSAIDVMLLKETYGYVHNLGTVKKLLQQGANPNQVLDDSDNALKSAIKSHNIRMLKMLLQADGDINIEFNKGNSLLSVAVGEYLPGKDASKTVKFLLEYGANPNSENQMGQKAIHLARERMSKVHYSTTEHIHLKKIVKLLDPVGTPDVERNLESIINSKKSILMRRQSQSIQEY